MNTNIKIAKTTLPAHPLTFEAWQRHIQSELFITQQRLLQYRLMELATGGVTIQSVKR